ncbi:hypothetical protein AALD22_06635 [Lachnospiraceae bacterium 56-18]
MIQVCFNLGYNYCTSAVGFDLRYVSKFSQAALSFSINTSDF